MRLLPVLVMVAVVGCHAEGTDGLQLRAADATRIDGTFGDATFSARLAAAQVYEVRFDLGRGSFGTDVDWNTYVATPRVPDGWVMSAADRARMGEMARAIEEEVGNGDALSDNLVRQANLWARHPEGTLALPAQIVADRLRGWTTLCNGTSYRTFNWSWGSTAKSEYLKYGPGETSNPCRARCGGGCTAAWGTSAWTVDCGRHDRCEQYGGSGANSQCNDELASASDDYSFAGNCSY
jgi:hypothetical protein